MVAEIAVSLCAIIVGLYCGITHPRAGPQSPLPQLPSPAICIWGYYDKWGFSPLTPLVKVPDMELLGAKYGWSQAKFLLGLPWLLMPMGVEDSWGIFLHLKCLQEQVGRGIAAGTKHNCSPDLRPSIPGAEWQPQTPELSLAHQHNSVFRTAVKL